MNKPYSDDLECSEIWQETSYCKILMDSYFTEFIFSRKFMNKSHHHPFMGFLEEGAKKIHACSCDEKEIF